ncbi:ABC transporter ATP-binding protein [Fodinibius sediminis]|uniref:Lipoprotein-releasing system ATP-binding protein n=1 Tax=Fodinibius sediminis TaxID=1214077 RepID=A0A521CRU4_9BACT|nr:ABC transporter ATP-binding protein [Fodinibius sediminis]SMO62174.1 lipoprotein-releasing system ATP-binding protein [Fodinibius sediminis]
MIILEAKDITKTYEEEGQKPLTVLNDASIAIEKGSILTVVGASGCGKSTLLHILGGLDQPNAGTVSWDGTSIYAMKREELARFRNKNMGFVFQFHHLLPEFTALENVMMPALIKGTPPGATKEKAQLLLSDFGILERAEHRPSQLSGGEQQRVAMARALINDPDLILADEPTGNLDERNTDMLLDFLFNLRQERELSILLITHEKNIAERSDVIYELSHGKLHAL